MGKKKKSVRCAAIISLGRCSYTHRRRKLHNVEGKPVRVIIIIQSQKCEWHENERG